MTVPPPPPPPRAASPPAPAPVLAGVGLRFVAVLLDGVLLMGLAWVLALLVGGGTSTGFVWSSPRRQRLGDRVADTVVARRAP
jgi:uncharacterized RDD family membrane protein YckC